MKNLLLSVPTIRNFVFERGVKRAIESGEYKPKKTPTHILDLGAHKGFATLWFARQYPNAVIHAYEPNPRLFPILKRNTRSLQHVSVFNEAIAIKDGDVQLHLSNNYLSSSIFGSGESIRVPATSLDTTVQRIGGESIFLKIDIEGAEYDVLKHIPPQINEIIGEAHPKKAGRSNAELRELLARFHDVSVGEGTSMFCAL